MSFLNPTLWLSLLPLLALPLLIHLLNKRFPRLFYFSSVKLLRETAAQRSRLFRWRHLILLVLRTLLLLLLLLAFLRPVLEEFGASSGPASQRHVLLLFDHSLSMEHNGDGITGRRRALLEAEKILNTLEAGDQVNILLAEEAPRSCFVDFSRNQAEARRFLEQLPAGLTRADFNRANQLAARLLAKNDVRAEIYYLSDFQRKNWSNVDFTTLPASGRLFFVDVGPQNRANHAVLAAGLSQRQILSGDSVPIEITVGNFSDEVFQGPITLVLDEQSRLQKEVSISPWSTATATVLLPVGSPGLHRCQISIPTDALAADNQHYLTLPVLEKEELLIVSDDPNPDRDAVLFLKTALNPYESQAGSLLPRHLATGELTSDQLAAVNKVFCTKTGRFDRAAANALARFLFQGGGLVYFLDGQFDPENLALLEEAVGPKVLPLKLTGRQVAEQVGTGAQQIIRGDFNSKFLQLFRGSRRQDLALLEFYDFYHASATGAGQILLSYADESPALASATHGLGTLLLLNFSVSEFSSNLARQRLFPAWMQDIVKNLSQDEPAPLAYVVGQSVQAELWRRDLAGEDLRAPSGRAVELKAEPLGERFAVTFVPAELGFYTLGNGPLHPAYGVNPNPDEADLRPVDRAILPEQLGEAQQGRFVSGLEDYQSIHHGRPIFHRFVLAGLGLLLVEMAFQWAVRKGTP